MAILVLDCPHCGIRQASFPIEYSSKADPGTYNYNAYGACPRCYLPIAISVSNQGTGTDPKGAVGNIGDTNRRDMKVLSVYPKRENSSSPEHVPDAAAKAFVEGSENLKDGRYSSAVAMFRRAIDVGTKKFNTDIDVFKLEKRIDKLAAERLITEDLKQWAHKIRLEGNEAIHELDEPTKEQTQELAQFTELVLVYLFTLPAKVKANLDAAA